MPKLAYASIIRKVRLCGRSSAGHQVSGYYLNRNRAAYWDGKNELGEQVASGVYIYELVTPTFKETKRLVSLKIKRQKIWEKPHWLLAAQALWARTS